MSKIKSEQFTWPQAIAWALAIVVILMSSVLMAQETMVEEEKRTSVSSFYSTQGRAQVAPDKVSQDDLAPFAKTGARDKSALRSAKARMSANLTALPNTDFWFYSADVQLFADDDLDGYFSGIDLLFDADTLFASADVYAVVYLSLEGGPWTEYAETDTFSIFGSSASDEYVIVTDLVAGYPAGSYDILIELFDAFDDSFLADMGPDASSALAFLPLEDASRDSVGGIGPQPVVVSHGGGGGGGAADVLTLVVLGFLTAGSVALRRRRQLSLRPARYRAPSA